MRFLGLNHVIERPGAMALSAIAPSVKPAVQSTVNYHAGMVLGDALGNDTCGNCVEAGAYRIAQMRTHAAQGSNWTPTAQEAVNLYSQVTGFNPHVAGSDKGTSVPDMMSWLAQRGLDMGLQAPDVQWPHVTINPEDVDEIRAGIDWFGGVGFSLALPNFVKTATDVWDVTPSLLASDAGTPGSWGGHWVPSGRFDGTTFWAITWGEEVLVTLSFLRAYMMAVDTGVSPLWFDTYGKAPSGFDIAALRQEASEVGNA